MNISQPFIHRPIATALLTAAVALAGAVAFRLLPVSPLPNVDFPTISVNASLPGASPETMAASVATPLERQFGRIAGVTEMTSASGLGSTSITLQFDLSRDIDAAGRDVQASINAARGYLPANLPGNPTYRKVNPADSPIFMLALTSQTYDKSAMYDAASTIMAQKLSQLSGVGQVVVGGSSLPGVRVELNPDTLNKYGLGLEQVRTALANANANSPKGHFSNGQRSWEVGATDQIFKAADYNQLIVSYHNGAAVRVSDVGEAVDSVEDLRNSGYANGKPSVLVIIFRQPGANIIDTVDGIRKALPQLKASIPQAIDVRVAMDQTVTIRASVHDVEGTLLISLGLVIVVVFVFLRNPRTTLIPAIAVPVSLIGTFGVMYLLHYSVDNLSLMALTISTGFVVDDAIVVVENITRYLEQGMKPMEAALKGAEEIGFTVLTISVSLIAVFIPLLLMGGIVGRLFREFAVVLSIAIFVSMLVSLTTTPMMAAHLLKHQATHGRMYRLTERAFDWVVGVYGRSLNFVLGHSFVTLLVLMATIALNVYLFVRVPKGFFPQQDTGRLSGSIQADQAASFQQVDRLLLQYVDVIDSDPAIDTVNGFTGGGRGGATNSARMFISLKPLEERKVSADQIINRLRPKLARIPGATLYLTSVQDLRVGGRQSNAQYQFTMRSDNVQDLTTYGPKMLQQLKTIKIIADVNSDQQNHGLQVFVEYDRSSAARFGISPQLIDNTLYDAFGQRPVSTMYTTLNQYHVVMEAAPQYWQDADILRRIYVRSPGGQQVPIGAFAHFAPEVAELSVNHEGLFPAVTFSFNLQPGIALGEAVDAIHAAAQDVGVPASVQTFFAGTAQAYQDSLGSEPYLIAAALATVYLVLGILYESYIHPITILSTLPSAGVGAMFALLLTRTDLSIIAMIGIILLIGIVKKNAILMIDFAIAAERNEGKNSRDAIFEACMLRFRPILMTTMAALLGALPLALGTGTGAELRRPLGITIIGGLIFSQMLTLFTTPVVYLYFDRLRLWWERVSARVREATTAGVRDMMRRYSACFGALLAAAAMLYLSGCAVGPNYKRPPAVAPPAFKEAPPPNFKEAATEGWKQAQPGDAYLKGKWWEIYQDPALNALEEQVSVNNQNVAQAEAQFRQAKAAVRVSRAALFPTLNAGLSAAVSGTVGSGGNTNGVNGVGGNTGTRFISSLPLDVSWEPDLWGNIRRGVTAAATTAQAFAADLENARLLFQSELAQDYFQLHGTDADIELLRRTEASFNEYLTLTQNRYRGGVASDLDVAQAEAQLYGTQSTLIDLGVLRAQLEHAIAILIGKAPAELTIPSAVLATLPPPVPVGVPSELLERRPDIAASERRVAAANEQIGIAMAAFYPNLTISGSTGFQDSVVGLLLSAPAGLWSVGAALAQPLFDAGRRRAIVTGDLAAYEATVATYRQTVLTAMQQVEDNLAALRILETEAAKVQETVASSNRALTISTAQYRAGTTSYLTVITSQAVVLNAERTAVSLQARRLTASVQLIEALGGGWNASRLPSTQAVTATR